jgi:hypothetical protein
MGRNKKNRVKLDGLLRQIARHEEKIEAESRRNNPDADLIRHWKWRLELGEFELTAYNDVCPEGSDIWL